MSVGCCLFRFQSAVPLERTDWSEILLIRSKSGEQSWICDLIFQNTKLIGLTVYRAVKMLGRGIAWLVECPPTNQDALYKAVSTARSQAWRHRL